jgi:homoserine O-acetyltransferase
MYGGILPEVTVAYETWGELSPARDNVIILWTGLSASQHAKSHEDNPDPGWWEKFVGSGCAIDTDKFFVICANNLGSCFGTTGPSSINSETGEPYATTFPMIGVEDMAAATFLLLDHLGIDKLYASVGSSLGGMLSLTAAVMRPDKIGRVVSISSCVRSHPVSIAMRYMQRKAIMLDPKWHKGHYYTTDEYPRMGVKIAREIATMTYRSGLEWEQRFGRAKIDENASPSLCPHFLIENYLDYQGESYVTKIDANTILYLSKAMDLFDLSDSYGDMHTALRKVKCPVLVIGAQTDILFPIWQQREMVDELQKAGNDMVTYYELNSLYGHDTFLLDLNGVGTGVKGFLETDNKNKGRARKRKDKQ